MSLSFRVGLIVFLVIFTQPMGKLILAQEVSDYSQQPPGQVIGEQPAVSPATPGSGRETKTVTTEDTSSPVVVPIMQIRRLETEEPLYSFELRDAEIGDLFRVLAHDYKLNLLVDKDVQGKVTASLSNVSLGEALVTITESQNLMLEKKRNVIWVRPNFITKIFSLKYIEAKKILESSTSSQGATAITAGTTGGIPSTAVAGATSSSAPSTGTAVPGSSPSVSTTSGYNQTSSTSSAKQVNTIYDLLSGKGRILLGNQANSIMVIDYPPNLEKIEKYLKEIDRKMASRVFKLKYLKATEVVGGLAATQAATTAAPTSTATATTAPASTGATY